MGLISVNHTYWNASYLSFCTPKSSASSAALVKPQSHAMVHAAPMLYAYILPVSGKLV